MTTQVLKQTSRMMSVSGGTGVFDGFFCLVKVATSYMSAITSTGASEAQHAFTPWDQLSILTKIQP